MHNSEFDSFRALLDKQAEVFGKPKPPDQLVQSYWHALRDQTFGTLEECSKRHVRYGKFFPKPFELRPKEEKQPVQESNEAKAKFEAALRFSTESWGILKAENPELYEKRLREAVLARLEVATHPSSPAYPQIQRESVQCAAERLAAGMPRW